MDAFRASETSSRSRGSPVVPSQSNSTRRRERASHQPTSNDSSYSQSSTPAYRDVYSHPAAVAYLAQHPKRTLPKFGPYLLLQTLGEGEFGKVKLGLHAQYGEEVAVKLIRRAGVDGTTRMAKVEREIEVLKILRHPNIVHLYDVIETDKYIGIIIEYASGGELFDHILAHRYLKEKDACKLFAQLISGVWYIHAKKIVHRDLKLENLLLDRNRNVIITDFGFANRFEHKTDDLMQTSCGSPCYAAPELVISEGLYVGSAVDIWSCGVILYAMLAGYLPFDDDPDNPDGDNINLLYKYIISTQLTFPEYVSPEARDLLSKMLVPDPNKRADLPSIMRHVWLEPYRYLFERSVGDLETVAQEQQRLKRLAWQRSARPSGGDRERERDKMQRSNSAAVAGSSAPGSVIGAGDASSITSRRAMIQSMVPIPINSAEDESKLYDSRSTAPPPSSSRKAIEVTNALITPSASPAPTPKSKSSKDSTRSRKKKESSSSAMGSAAFSPGIKDSPVSSIPMPTIPIPAPGLSNITEGSQRRRDKAMRHTIQVEYDEPSTYDEMGSMLPRSHLLTPTAATSNPSPFATKIAVDNGKSVPPSLVISSESDAEKEKDRISKIPVDGEDPFFSIANGELRYSLGMGGIEISDSMPPTPTQPQVAHIQPSQVESATTKLNGVAGGIIPPGPSISQLIANGSPTTTTTPTGKKGDGKIEMDATPTSTPTRRRAQSQNQAVDRVVMGIITPPTPTRTERESGNATPIASSPPPPTTPSARRSATNGSQASTTGSWGQSTATKALPPVEIDEKDKDKEQEKEKLSSTPGSVGKSDSSGSTSTSKRRIKGLSIDKLGFGKLLSSNSSGTNGHLSRRATASESTPPSSFATNHSTSGLSTSAASADGADSTKESETEKEKEVNNGQETVKEAKTRRRKTLSIMMEPLMRTRSKQGKTRSIGVESGKKELLSPRTVATPTIASASVNEFITPTTPQFPDVRRPSRFTPLSASTNKAQKVMQWFRGGKNRASESDLEPDAQEIVVVPRELDYPPPDTAASFRSRGMESTSTFNHSELRVAVTPATPDKSKSPSSWLPIRSVSHGVPSAGSVAREEIQAVIMPKGYTYNPDAIRIHHGAVDQGTVTSGAPPEVFAHVTQVLLGMGVEVQKEEDYKYRCIRPKRRKDAGPSYPPVSSGGLAAFNITGSAALNGVDQRGLPTTNGAAGMFRNLLMRRHSSRPATSSGSDTESHSRGVSQTSEYSNDLPPPLPTSVMIEPLYGEKSIDAGDEVRFSVELTRIDRLDDTFSLDIRRLKGNLRSYKYLYDSLRERCNFQG